MTTLDRPKLRPLSASRFDYQGQPYALLQDPLGAFTSPVLVPLDAFMHVCRHFDGLNPLAEIQRGSSGDRAMSCRRGARASGRPARSGDGSGRSDFRVVSGDVSPVSGASRGAGRPVLCGRGRDLAGSAPRVFPWRRGRRPAVHRGARPVSAASGSAQPAHRFPQGRSRLHVVVQESWPSRPTSTPS